MVELPTTVAAQLTDPPPQEAGGTGVSDAARQARQKWGVAFDGGFQIVPDILLRRQSDLKLTTTDMVVLLNLMMSWWIVGQAPFPRASTIAKRMGASERTVQRSLTRLRALRLIQRTKITAANNEERLAYDLTPLAQKLSKLAEGDCVTQRRLQPRAGGAGVHTPPLGQPQQASAGGRL